MPKMKPSCFIVIVLVDPHAPVVPKLVVDLGSFSAEQTCSYRSVSPQYILKSSIWMQGSHETIPRSLTRRPTSSSPSSRACVAPTEISRDGRVEVYNEIHSGAGPRRADDGRRCRPPVKSSLSLPVCGLELGSTMSLAGYCTRGSLPW